MPRICKSDLHDWLRSLPTLLALDLASNRKLAVPLILFAGRHDYNLNSEVAAAWFDTVDAPEKHLVWFEHSAHMPMTEEPGKFCLFARALRAADRREGGRYRSLTHRYFPTTELDAIRIAAGTPATDKPMAVCGDGGHY